MTAALILAGGRGTRLGGVDKAFVELSRRPLIAHLIARLAPQVGRIAISANGDSARFAPFGLPVLADGGFAGKGPLAGVAAGLDWAAESLLTVPVDTPFIPDDLAARLSPAPAVAVWRGRQHHLVAHWPAGVGGALADFLRAPGAYRVRDALILAGARQADFAAAADPFLNVNTMEDLAVAERRQSLISSPP